MKTHVRNLKGLTLHVPTPPYQIVKSNFILPSQSDTLETVPFG